MITSRARYIKLKFNQRSGTTNLTLMENGNMLHSNYQKTLEILVPIAAKLRVRPARLPTAKDTFLTSCEGIKLESREDGCREEDEEITHMHFACSTVILCCS